MVRRLALILQLVTLIQLVVVPVHGAESARADIVGELNHELTPHLVFALLKTQYRSPGDQQLLTDLHAPFRQAKVDYEVAFAQSGLTYEIKIANKVYGRIYDFDDDNQALRINGKVVKFTGQEKFQEIYQVIKAVLAPRTVFHQLSIMHEADALGTALSGLATAGIILFARQRAQARMPSDQAQLCMENIVVTEALPPGSGRGQHAQLIQAFYDDRGDNFNNGTICREADRNGMPLDHNARARLMWSAQRSGRFTSMASCIAKHREGCVTGGFNMTTEKARASCAILYKLKRQCEKLGGSAIPGPLSIAPVPTLENSNGSTVGQ